MRAPSRFARTLLLKPECHTTRARKAGVDSGRKQQLFDAISATLEACGTRLVERARLLLSGGLLWLLPLLRSRGILSAALPVRGNRSRCCAGACIIRDDFTYNRTSHTRAGGGTRRRSRWFGGIGTGLLDCPRMARRPHRLFAAPVTAPWRGKRIAVLPHRRSGLPPRRACKGFAGSFVPQKNRQARHNHYRSMTKRSGLVLLWRP